jgi:hypothetical protein
MERPQLRCDAVCLCEGVVLTNLRFLNREVARHQFAQKNHTVTPPFHVHVARDVPTHSTFNQSLLLLLLLVVVLVVSRFLSFSDLLFRGGVASVLMILPPSLPPQPPSTSENSVFLQGDGVGGTRGAGDGMLSSLSIDAVAASVVLGSLTGNECCAWL